MNLNAEESSDWCTYLLSGPFAGSIYSEGYMRVDKTKLTAIERDLVEGLEGFVKNLKNDERISDKYTCRRMVLDLHPQSYTAKQVKSTRKLLRVSQTLFAQFLGVSPKTVRSWEQGQSPPRDIACRFMDEIQRNPEYWRKRIAESAKMRPRTT